MLTRKVFSVPRLAEFKPWKHFRVGFDPAQIGYLGENFQKLLDEPCPEECPHQYVALTLSSTLTCKDFRDMFGDRCIVPISLIWHLITRPIDDQRMLIRGGQTNIFVVMYQSVMYTVGLFWYKNGWSIRAYPFSTLDEEKLRRWFAGNQIIVKVF